MDIGAGFEEVGGKAPRPAPPPLPANRCSGAQSKCGGRAIKRTFQRRLAENEGCIRRTLSETGRTIIETDARPRKFDAHYLRPGRQQLSD